MILQLTANVPKLVAHIDGVATIYVRQYGAGNLRLSTESEGLRNSAPNVVAPGQIADGIPQAAAAGVVQYFWSGDLWIISDQADAVMILVPAYAFLVDRSQGIQQAPADASASAFARNDLSTYPS